MNPSFSPRHSAAHLRARNRVIIAGICSLILTVGIARFAYTPMLPIMLDEAGLTKLLGGWLATYNYAGYLIGALIAATLKELSVKYHLYRAYLLVAILTTLGMGLTENSLVWSVLRFLSGISSTAGLLLASGLVMNWLMANQFKPQLGVHFIGMGVGIMFTGGITAVMVDHLSWSGQWIGLGLWGLLFLIPAWLWMPAPKPYNPGDSAQSAEVPGKRFMNLLIATYFCAGVGYVISATFIVDILENLPELQGRGGWVWVFVGLAALPSAFVWDKVANALGEIVALQLAYLLQIISFIIPLLSDNSWLNFLSAGFYGGTFVGIVSLTLALVGRYFPKNPAKAMARLTLSFCVAQILAPVAAGYIAAETGSYQGSLLLATLVMLTGMLLLHLMGYKPKHTV